MVNRLNSLTQSKKLKRLAWVGFWCVLIWFGLIWFGLFRWNVFDGYEYSSINKPTFSPNCDFYITTHQALWERVFDSHWPNMFGTARLHNRAGTVLFEEKTQFGVEGGPYWNSVEDGLKDNEVSMRVNSDDIWRYLLPSSPGTMWKARNCAKFEEETQSLNAMTQRPELTIPLKECSFKFANVFKGWFLNVSQHFRSPSASYEGAHPIQSNQRVTIRLSCRDADEVKATQASGAPLGWDSATPIFTEDQATGRWHIRPVELSADMEKQLLSQGVMNQAQITAFKDSRTGGFIQAVNDQGFYALERDVLEERETKLISFEGCIFRSSRALCAQVDPIGDTNHPEQDLTPYMLKLLQSVEFVPETLEGKE